MRLQLVFDGEFVRGFEPRAVRRSVSHALKLDSAALLRLFSGRRLVLRRDLDEATAHRYIAHFLTLGAVVRAEPSEPPGRRRRRRPRRPPPRPWVALMAWRAASLPRFNLVALLALVVVAAMAATLWRLSREPFPPPPPPERATGPTPGATPWPTDAAQGPNAATVPPAPAAAPAAAQPPQPLQKPQPPSPATAQPAAEQPPPDMTADALRVFQAHYLTAPLHRAFAISSSGSYGWEAGAPNENRARELAVEICVKRAQDPFVACRVVHADGQWLE